MHTTTKATRQVNCLEALIKDIPNRSFPLEKIILFGSFASNRFHPRSDLDLCLIHPSAQSPTPTEKVAIESYFDHLVGQQMDVDYVYATPEKLTTGSQVFASIRKEGLILWERSGK